ncbi:MAG: hypothetical protein CMG71_02795 [Candidatus Marinimicrobia bacterium]|nr:hypothetical protein [Candidatus Neomarinimicrobiota bacterium]|tara:strand:+ start:4573 stop:5802 length:1230 start_codon:yes stop_codon:yes gene_type:complete
MNRFPTRVLILFSILLVACENDAFITNLDHTSLTTHEVSTTSFRFKTYQVPPTLGGVHSIYIGKKEEIDASQTLVEFESHEILRWANIVIDSGHFQFTLDTNYTGLVPEVSSITMGYFRRDSNYAELESNYSNVDWIVDDYPKLSSHFVTDSTGLTHLRFPVDSATVETLADTAEGSWLYVLESPETADYMLQFYASESPVYQPLFRTFLHSNSSDSDTSEAKDSVRVFTGRSDVTLFIPPDLSSGQFDSSFSYLGVATGLVTVFKPDLGVLAIPEEATIGRAKLSLPFDVENSSTVSLDSLYFQAYALEDSVLDWKWGEVLTADSYEHHTATFARSSSAAPVGSILKLDVTELLQSIISGRDDNGAEILNVGIKLKMINSATVFDFAAMRTDSSASGQPLLEVFYEVP